MQMIGPLKPFNMFNVAMFVVVVVFFFAKFLNMCNPRTTFYLLWHWHFMEVDQHAYRAAWR